MDGKIFVKESLKIQGLPIYEIDIPYILDTLHTINASQRSLNAYPYLNEEIPITIVDKGMMK